MKLRNKKTGEIGWLYCDHISVPKKMTVFAEDKDLSANHWDYKSLAELNEEWGDYEEKGWYITENGEVRENRSIGIVEEESEYREIGNYFDTREEAEKAVEKLKALKRLKDKGFKFERWLLGGEYGNTITFSDYIECNDKTKADLDLLFGGGE